MACFLIIASSMPPLCLTLLSFSNCSFNGPKLKCVHFNVLDSSDNANINSWKMQLLVSPDASSPATMTLTDAFIIIYLSFFSWPTCKHCCLLSLNLGKKYPLIKWAQLRYVCFNFLDSCHVAKFLEKKRIPWDQTLSQVQYDSRNEPII